MMNPLITRLRRLTNLTEKDLDSLEQACSSTQSIVIDADIAPQGDRPSHFHILVEGWAGRYVVLPDGRRQIPALLVPGDICDLDGLLLRRVNSGVCAITPCKVAMLPHAQLRDMIDQSPAIRDAFWWLQSVENAVQTEWLVGLGRRSAEERVAHLLCELHIRLGSVDLSSDKGFALPLTQPDLADVLGLSVVHVSRTVMRLRDLGMIALKERWLKILDLDALKAAGSFNPDYLHLEGLSLSRTPGITSF